jgi:UDP-glucose 4-epimerase
MAVLVTGGAGYIGSVTAEQLRKHGERVVVLDNLFRGHREAVDPDVPFYEGQIGDRALVQRICREHRVDACVHFAALAYVGESVHEPAKYFENNVEQGLGLLSGLLACDVKRVVFSSTCATYGEPEEVPIPETHKQWPVNPYGWSKFFMERILESYDAAYGMKFVALRYFNASGCTESKGEDHEPESHLIPNILFAAMGRQPFVQVFGSDYPTPDGTAIRDYIHVVDLAEAHILALEHLRKGGPSDYFNLGTGTGFSVMEVIQAARKVTGRDIPVKMGPRRAGDPPRLVAVSDKARRGLGWKPQLTDLETILASAWKWHQAHPNGYAARSPAR